MLAGHRRKAHRESWMRVRARRSMMMTTAVRPRHQPSRPTLQSRQPPLMPTSYQFRQTQSGGDGRCCFQQRRKRSSRRSSGCPTIPKTLLVSSACRNRSFGISLTHDRVFDGQKEDLEHVSVHVRIAQSLHWPDSYRIWFKEMREVEHSRFRNCIAHITCITHHTLAVTRLRDPPKIGPPCIPSILAASRLK